MTATQQNDFLTLVSYSTLNTFGVYLAPLRLCPRGTFPLAHCKWPQLCENITSPAFWKFEIPYLGQMESDFLRIKTVIVSVLRPIICTGKIGGIAPLRGQSQKVPRPKNFWTPNFGGCVEVDLPIILHIVQHDTVCQNAWKNVGQNTRDSHKVKNSKFWLKGACTPNLIPKSRFLEAVR